MEREVSEETKELLKDYADMSMTLKDIGAKYGKSHKSITAIAKRHGAELRNQLRFALPAGAEENMVKMFEAGNSVLAIAKHSKTSYERVRRILCARGVNVAEKQKKGPRGENIRGKTESQEAGKKGLTLKEIREKYAVKVGEELKVLDDAIDKHVKVAVKYVTDALIVCVGENGRTYTIGWAEMPKMKMAKGVKVL